MTFGIILTPDVRSKAYLQKSLTHNFNFDKIIFLNDLRTEPHYNDEELNLAKHYGFDLSIPVKTTLKNHSVDYTELEFVDINHNNLIDLVHKSKIDIFIFTGGGILKNSILNAGSKFIHLHPGIVPEYRGSTCFYYSILNENKCGVTAFFMDPNLDTGDIIFQKIFEKPHHQYLDNVFDAHIRSETLIEIIQKNLLESNSFQVQNPKIGNTYFIIHPVLKHIAILSCLKSND